MSRYISKCNSIILGVVSYIVEAPLIYKEQVPTNVEFNTPESFELYQNYPNPFNPSTRIQYQVSSISYVSLVVYDILGNEVATLVDEEKEPGFYEVTFDRHSGEVQNLASGIYIYQLRTADFIDTKKMILLR